MAAVLFFGGAILEGISGMSFWSGDWGLVVLMLGRVAYGLGCGFAMHGVSLIAKGGARSFVDVLVQSQYS